MGLLQWVRMGRGKAAAHGYAFDDVGQKVVWSLVL